MTEIDRTDTPRRDAEERMLQASDAPRLARWVNEPSAGFYRGANHPEWMPPADYHDHLNTRPDVPRPLPERSIEEQLREDMGEDHTALAWLVRAHVGRCFAAHRAVYDNPTVAALPQHQRLQVAQQAVHVLTDPCSRPRSVEEAVDAITARIGAPADAVTSAVLTAMSALTRREQP